MPRSFGAPSSHGDSQEGRGDDKIYEAQDEIQQESYGPSASPTRPRQSFGSKAKRHCAKWWWVHLIVFCLIFLLVALLLVYVGLPRISQHDVNKSWLEITGLEFLDPTPSSLVLTQRAILHNPSIFTPTLAAFSAASWLVINGTYGPDIIVNIPLPQIHAQRPQSNVTALDQRVDIENLDQLTIYATELLLRENVTTALTGKTKLHLGALPVVDIDYNTTTTYKGLNRLKGFSVDDLKLNSSAEAGAPNLSGFANVPNPSLITVAMGNVTLVLSTTAGVVGTSTIENFTIVPGNNTLPLTATVNQTLVLASAGKDGTLEMDITGRDSIYNGEHISYYETALSSNKLSVTLNVTEILANSI